MSRELYRILLVEDNAADVYLFRKALEQADLNFELTVLDDGAEALAFARHEREYAETPVPHLTVLDLNLPKNGGIEVLKAMRESSRLRSVPVVITSSSASPRERAETERLGVDRYIMKPPDLEKFLEIGAALKQVLLTPRG